VILLPQQLRRTVATDGIVGTIRFYSYQLDAVLRGNATTHLVDSRLTSYLVRTPSRTSASLSGTRQDS